MQIFLYQNDQLISQKLQSIIEKYIQPSSIHEVYSVKKYMVFRFLLILPTDSIAMICHHLHIIVEAS